MENSVFQGKSNGLKGGDENSHPEKETNATVPPISNSETATTSKFVKSNESSSNNNGLSFRVPLKTLNGPAVNSKDTKPVEKKSRKGCVAEVVVWKGRVNNFITPQPPKKLPQNAPGQLFVVSYPDVDVPLSQRQKDPPKTKTILKKDKLVRKSEPKPRIDTGGGQRRIPRTTKQPKKFKFISVEEHHQLLQEYIKNASKKASDEKENKENANTDFRLDSLFKQENDQNPSSTATKAVETVTTSSASCSTEVSNGLQQPIQSTSFPVSNELSVAMDESCHSHMDDSGVSQHSFPVDSEDICNIDDVARYELVESTNEFSSVDFEAFAALGTISTFGNSNVRRPAKVPRMQQQRRKSVSATTTTEDENGTRTIDIVVDETGKPRCTYTELIEKALTEAGDLTVSEIYQWISNKYPFFRPEDDRWKNSVRHNLSINPYFKKGEKSRGGAGHLWTISEESKGMRPNYKRKSNENLYELELCMPMESDTDRAVASILGQYNLARANQLQQEQNIAIDDNICKEAPPQEQQVPTETVECPDDILIGYDSLPPGTYTLELNGLQLETENLFDLDSISQTGYVIVSKDDSNKENLENMANIMDEVSAFAHFPYINENCNSGLTESSNTTFENISDVDEKKNSFNRDLNNRGEYFPMPDPPICQPVLEEKHPLTPDSSNELLLLESIGASSSVALEEVMEATCSSEDPLPIMSESLFDAKELGMIYQYDEDVPRD